MWYSCSDQERTLIYAVAQELSVAHSVHKVVLTGPGDYGDFSDHNKTLLNP